jgi:CRP/FNR family cyclic AMP-dependent transcriptional regulator
MNRSATIEDRLAALPLFAGVRRSNLRRLSRLMTPVTLPPGRTLTTEGTPGAECMLIIEGRARVVRHGQVVATLGAGDVVGEIAVLHGGPRTATVQTDTETTLEVFTPREFVAALHERPEMARVVRERMATRLQALETAAS